MLKEDVSRKRAIALGNFDGIHIGHREIIKNTAGFADCGFEPCVLLFFEHSIKTLSGSIPPMLMSENERKSFFVNSGFSVEYINFNEIKDMTPSQFVGEILVGKFNAGAVICGYNYRFGKNAQGNADTMSRLCENFGIKCVVVGEVDYENEPVSSTLIRRLIENGSIEKANVLLGRNFGFCSEIIDGDKRGRKLGIPTANQKLPENFVVPKFGVYKSLVTVDGEAFNAVTNIGIRPTVGTDVILSETHILNFSGDIYGKTVDVRLIGYIRDEKKFESFDELKSQINEDIKSVAGGKPNV